MKYEEVIDYVEETICYHTEACSDGFCKDGQEGFECPTNMLIVALEKQIPKRPYRCRTSGGQKGNMCPKCQRLLTLGYPQHCEFCGQAIDWS